MTQQHRVEDRRPPAVALMGPTACGKTDFAIALAQRFPFELISVDSALVYRGMDIGTAKPGPEILATVPHRLIDVVDPAEAYSAARFRQDALRELEDILAAGKVPLLVGGTMLYFRALQHGLAALPAADPATRAQIAAEAQVRGWPALHARLREVDPDSAAGIHPNDPQRIQRALEVYAVSGCPMSVLTRAQQRPHLPVRLLKLAVADRDRASLHRRIAARFERMLEQGFIEEVAGLRARSDLSAELPAMRAVGYRQVWAYLEGNLSYPEMVERGVIATRQLAKRQMTWLRAEPDLHWHEPLTNETLRAMSARIDAWLNDS